MLCGCNVFKEFKEFKFSNQKGNKHKNCINKFKITIAPWVYNEKAKRVSKDNKIDF